MLGSAMTKSSEISLSKHHHLDLDCSAAWQLINIATVFRECSSAFRGLAVKQHAY